MNSFSIGKKTEVTWSQDNASDHRSAQALAVIQNASFELLCHPLYSPFVFVLHGKWLAGRPGTTIFLQPYQSVEEMTDQVHFRLLTFSMPLVLTIVSANKLGLITASV